MKIPDNKNKAVYLCTDTKKDRCVYFAMGENGLCRYAKRIGGLIVCKSEVAKVNRCVLELQKMTGKKWRAK